MKPNSIALVESWRQIVFICLALSSVANAEDSNYKVQGWREMLPRYLEEMA